nr:MAG TPA: hypothetical protein [Caudoviricetes sp.]
MRNNGLIPKQPNIPYSKESHVYTAWLFFYLAKPHDTLRATAFQPAYQTGVNRS